MHSLTSLPPLFVCPTDGIPSDKFNYPSPHFPSLSLWDRKIKDRSEAQTHDETLATLMSRWERGRDRERERSAGHLSAPLTSNTGRHLFSDSNLFLLGAPRAAAKGGGGGGKIAHHLSPRLGQIPCIARSQDLVTSYRKKNVCVCVCATLLIPYCSTRPESCAKV